MIELNIENPKIVGTISPIDLSTLIIPSVKNMALKSAIELYKDTPILAAIHSMIPLLGSEYEIPLVDVKLHHLKTGDVPCIPGWHIDGGPDVPSNYLLCVAGSSLTEFYTNTLSLPKAATTRAFCDHMDKAIGNNPTFVAPEWAVIGYNHLNPHRGGLAKGTGPRLLIRLMASNKIKAVHDRDWRPSVYRSSNANR